MSPTLVFIHKGDATYLSYAAVQALSSGYRTLVVGDDAVRDRICVDAPAVEFHHISELSGEADDFARRYTHLSVNSYEYELFCFQRWYVLVELMKIVGGPVIYLDSDILIYPGLTDAWIHERLHGAALCNSAWFNYIRDPDTLRQFLKFNDQMFASMDDLRYFGERHAIDSRPHVSDMIVLQSYFYESPRACVNLCQWGCTVGLDGNIRTPEGMKMHLGHKKITFRSGLPFADPEDGGELRLFTLHFQGMSKPLMRVMNTISDQRWSQLEQRLATLPEPGREADDQLSDLGRLYQEYAAAR